MKQFKQNLHAVVDLNVILMIGIAFAALMVLGYIIFKVRDQLLPTYPSDGGTAANASQAAWNTSWRNASYSIANVTGGFDDAVNLLLVAITIFILAIAIGALLMLRGRKG